MKTNWDWDYFYSEKMKDWENCKTRRYRRDWRKRHCDLAIDNFFSSWRLEWGYRWSNILTTIKGECMKAIKGTSWQYRRIFLRKFKRELEKAAKESIRKHRIEWVAKNDDEIELLEKEALDVISDFVNCFKAWTSPFLCMTKPENIIALEFGKSPTLKAKKEKEETFQPSIFWKIVNSVRKEIECHNKDLMTTEILDARLKIEDAINQFLKTRFSDEKIRMFRPTKKEFKEYILNSICRKTVDVLVDMYCNAYDKEMPLLCGLVGEYSFFAPLRRQAYFRYRKVSKVLRKCLKKFDKIPIDFEAYYKLNEAQDQETDSGFKIDGEIDSEQCVLEEIHDLIIKVVHPILGHLAQAAVRRAEIGGAYPVWDEKFKFEGRTQGGLLKNAAEDAGVEKELAGLKSFTIQLGDTEKSSYAVYDAVYQWYWKKGLAIFNEVIANSKLWKKKG